jgi:holo-[acyl-carrier protein] synthase
VELKIVRHGIDLVDIAEMRRWIEDPRDPLIPRCFVQEELDELGDGPNRVERLAGWFAAKEAVLKALGTGFGAGVAFSDVIIHSGAGTPPTVRLTGGAERAAANLGIVDWQLSISHTGVVAMASVIAIGAATHGEVARPTCSMADKPR